MSDWEDVFGAGVSAESVINGLKSDEEYEEEERRRILGRKKREAEVQKRKALTAYRDDPSIKLALVSQLQNHERVRGQRPLEILFEGGYAAIELAYNIPEALARLIDDIYLRLADALPRGIDFAIAFGKCDARVAELKRERKKKSDGPIDWLTDCLRAIEPGVDLRFIVTKFVADVANSALLTLDSLHLEGDTSALAVVLARARGVIVPDWVAVAVAKAAWSAVSDGGVEIFTGYYDDRGLCEAIIATAAQPSPDMEEIINYATKTEVWRGYPHEERVYGSIDWETFSLALIELIKTAPTDRLRIVDLEKVTSQLSLAEQDDTRQELLASNLCLSCHKPKEPSRPKSSKCRACDRALPVYFSTSEALFLREAVGHFLKAEDVDASPELLSVLKRLKIKLVPE